ncbi:MAG: carboxylesterase family protein [Rhodospirillaceae bacterium]|nr:carboxylesterase family protein [Rhodospirillales bacterium]
MRTIRALLAGMGISAVLLSGSVNAATTQADTIVKTDHGKVRGVIQNGVREFKGIPYAAPPVGDLRWVEPQPLKPWTGVLDATKYGSACPQLGRYGLTEASETEDCLHINVTAPYSGKREPNHKRPVIVWIHGGGFVGGSSALYPLDTMAKSGDAVVVSLNYRVGVFGFMPHPGFGKAHNGGYGLEDQRAAMRWVKRNIAAFGGDPNNITLAAESAGASSVCMHIVAPKETTGLFNKAIIQSGGCAHQLKSVAESSATGTTVAAKVGCLDAATAPACMRTKPVNDLLNAATEAMGSNLMTYAPSFGTDTVPLQPSVAIDSGQIVKVPMINGGNRDELRLYVAYAVQGGDVINAGNYSAHLESEYGKDKVDDVLAEYPLENYSSPPVALAAATSDFTLKNGLNNCIYLQGGKSLAKHVDVYEYVFADANAPPVTEDPGFEMGAVHSAELPYQFPHFSNTTKLDGPDLAPASQRLADQMMAYWTSFAKTGKPSAPNSPHWNKFTADKMVLQFEPGKVGYFDASDQHKCGFWKKQYPDILTKIVDPTK